MDKLEMAKIQFCTALESASNEWFNTPDQFVIDTVIIRNVGQEDGIVNIHLDGVGEMEGWRIYVSSYGDYAYGSLEHSDYGEYLSNASRGIMDDIRKGGGPRVYV